METGNNTSSDAQAIDSTTSAIHSPNATDTATKANTNVQTKPTQPTALNVPAGKPSASTATTASSSRLKEKGCLMDDSLVFNKVATDTAAVSTADVRATPISHAPPPISQEPSVTVEETTLQKQKLVEEFQYLLEKSQSLFSGLR